MLRERRRLQFAQRLQCLPTHPAGRVRVLEPLDHGLSVLRERRRLQFAQRLQCLPTHLADTVLEPRNHSIDVLRERPRPKTGQRLQHPFTHVRVRLIGFLETRCQSFDVLFERRQSERV